MRRVCAYLLQRRARVESWKGGWFVKICQAKTALSRDFLPVSDQNRLVCRDFVEKNGVRLRVYDGRPFEFHLQIPRTEEFMATNEAQRKRAYDGKRLRLSLNACERRAAFWRTRSASQKHATSNFGTNQTHP